MRSKISAKKCNISLRWIILSNLYYQFLVVSGDNNLSPKIELVVVGYSSIFLSINTLIMSIRNIEIVMHSKVCDL